MTISSQADYKKYLNLISKKKYLFVVVALLIMTAVVVYSYYFKPEQYQVRCTVSIEKSLLNNVVQGLATTPSVEDNIGILVHAIKSRPVLLKVIQDLNLGVGNQNPAQQESMVKGFQDGTSVTLNDKGELFTVSYSHGDPRFARDYVDALVRRYIKETMSIKREESTDATKFLSGQISAVKEKLDKAEAQANSFKTEKANILGENEQNILQEISDAQGKIDEISVKRNQLEAQRNMVRKNDPLSMKLAGLQKRLEELNVVYTDNYPEVISVKNEIESIKREIKPDRGAGGGFAAMNSQELEKIGIELKTLGDLEKNQKRFIASKRAVMQNLPAARAALAALEQERNSRKSLYEQLVARHGQSELSKQMEVQDKATPFRIVEPAIIPIKPINMNRVRMILIGIFSGLTGSLGLLVLLDYLDNSVQGC